MRRAALVVVVAALTGCRGRALPRHDEPGRVPPAPPLDPLTTELVELVGARKAAILAGAVGVPDGAHDSIPVVGACRRPTDDERASLAARVEAWIEDVHPGARGDASIDLRFGCVEPAGVVVEAVVDLDRDGHRATRHRWALRLGKASTAVLGAIEDCEACDDAPGGSIGTVVLAQLDRDGALDAVFARPIDDDEGRRRFELSVDRRIVARSLLPARLARFQPEPSTLVLALWDEQDGEVKAHRCVPTWDRCPAAVAAARAEDAVAAAKGILAYPIEAMRDRYQLEQELALLDVAPADRARFVVAAEPTPLSWVPGHFFAHRDRRHPDVEPGDDLARSGAATLRLLDRLEAALGDRRCAPVTEAQRAAALAQVERWLATRTARPGQVEIDGGCAGTAGGYWLARMQDSDPRGLHRVALFFGADTLVPVVEQTIPRGEYMNAGLYLTAKLSLRGGAMIALVLSSTATAPRRFTLIAVVDGAITGRRPAMAVRGWPAVDPDVGLIQVEDDSLVRVVDGDTVAYYQAGPAGVVEVASFTGMKPSSELTRRHGAASLLEAQERLLAAESLLHEVHERGRRASESERAEIVAAMKLLGAPADLLELAATAPP